MAQLMPVEEIIGPVQLDEPMSDSEDEDVDPSREELERVLGWIGYDTEPQVTALADELGSLKKFSTYSTKDLAAMVKDGVTYGANRKLKFPLARQKHLKQIIDWAKDRLKLNEPVSLASANIDDQDEFLEAIQMAQERKEIREKEKDTHDSQLKAANPGKLKDEKDWEAWLTGLQTTLTLMRGVTDVPLLYVIRDDITPLEGVEYESFDEECIAKAPLTGPAFNADSRSVHLVIKPLIVGENAEQWIQSGFKKKNGREDLAHLTAFFQGEGNSSGRIYVAEQMWKSLHYKGERAMPFATFLSKAQKMFNLFYRNKEPKPMAAQVRWLLDQVKDPDLIPTIAGLRIDIEKDHDHKVWDFKKCSGHISSQVRANNPPGDTKGISGVNTGGAAGRNGIYKDGNIYTGTYSNAEWTALTRDERSLVISARGGTKGENGGGKSQGAQKKKHLNKVKALTKKVKKQEKIISSLKKRASSLDEEGEEESDEPARGDAGTAFGGKAGKATQKKKKKTD